MSSKSDHPLEYEPDDKDRETVIEFYLEAFKHYIADNVDFRDLMFYDYFEINDRRAFRDKAKNSTNRDVVLEMIDTILAMKTHDRFTKLVYGEFGTTNNDKVLSVLKGKRIPKGDKSLYNKLCKRDICETLDLVAILPHLVGYNIITTNEAEQIMNKKTNCSSYEAAWELILIIGNRNEDWYIKFMMSLCKIDQKAIAEKLDKQLCDELKKIKDKTSEKGEHSAEDVDEFIVKELRHKYSSLAPISDTSCAPGRTWYPDESLTTPKEYETDETGQKFVIQTEETKRKQIASDSSFNTLEASVQYDSKKPSMSENNLSPYKPDECTGEFQTLDVEPVRRSLESSLSDSSLSFSLLLQDTENVRVSDTSISDNRKSNDQRSIMMDSTSSAGNGLDSFHSFLTKLDPSSIIDNTTSQRSYDSTKITDSNLAQREASWRDTPGATGDRGQDIQWSDIQNITTECKLKNPQNNDDTSNQDNTGHKQVVNYDENSQDQISKQLKDKDLNVRFEERNITASDESLEETNRDDIPDIDVTLRKYQEELARPALNGNNVIIVAPTGSGKTRVAMRIIQNHIRQQKGRSIAKVIFLVNQVALANQQGEACKELLKKYSCEVITGESQRKMKCLKDFIHKRDILVVTAQVLLDAMINKEIEGISCFSLIVFDECHHTYANHTFNAIMGRYMDLKFHKDDAVLPQIVGLTASVGVGKSRTIEKAVNHIKRLMANLDAHEICTVNENITELREHVSLPEEETRKVPRREDDPYGDALRKLISTIERRMSQSSLVREIPESAKLEAIMKPPSQKGTAQYTQWVNKLWREIVKIKCPNARRFLTPCRQHLDLYNNALIIYNDARLEDAKHYLDTEMNAWKEEAVMDDNENMLYGAYTKLKKYPFKECPNPKLDMLGKMVEKAFRGNSVDSRGIVFVKTRALAKAVVNWMKEMPVLRELNPIQFVGQNMSADKGGMTKVEQDDALKYFRDGRHKLIVATSVAEEGLDISKCNLVIRYDHVTNEIAMVQSRGRGRAADSKYYVIAEDATGMAEKEELNMIREVMMRKAIIQLQNYIKNNQESFKKELHRYQDEANLDRELKAFGKKRKVIRTGQFELKCIKCDHFICWSEDVKKIEGAHHVIVDPSIEERVKINTAGQARYQNETIQLVGKMICKNCGGNLGTVLIHRKIEFPVPRIENFLIVDKNGRQDMCKQWKLAPFVVLSLSTEDWREILANFKDKEGIM